MYCLTPSRFVCLAFLGSAALLNLGCGSDSGLVTITGKAPFDGKPIQDGSISLQPTDPTAGVAGGGVIENGYYSAESSRGEMAVQIYATHVVIKKNPTQEEIERGLVENKEPLPIPAVYNRQSKLRIDVSPENDSFDFDLNTDGEIPAEFQAK